MKGQREREDKVFEIDIDIDFLLENIERDDNKETNKARHR